MKRETWLLFVIDDEPFLKHYFKQDFFRLSRFVSFAEIERRRNI